MSVLLSYGGVIGIVFFLKPIREIFEKTKIPKYIKEIASVSIAVQIVIMPVMIYSYKTMSLTFIISNILTSGLIGIIIILGFIIAFSSLFLPLDLIKIVGIPYNMLINILLKTTQITSQLPFSKIYVKTPFFYQIICYYILAFYLINAKKFKLNQDDNVIKRKQKNLVNKIVAILLVVMLIGELTDILPNNLQIYFIDVGQGDSTLIVTPQRKTILIDGGGSTEEDVGKDILLPYLLSRRVKKIDYIICSHFDTDHVGGILYLLKEIKVNKVIIGEQFEKNENYEEFKRIVKSKKIYVKIVKEGEKINIENNLYFDILWPSSTEKVSKNTINNNALVCKLNYKEFTMLFTGDIEEETEKILVSKYQNTNVLKSTILKVGHHGSKTSSTNAFIQAVNPQIALIGVGKNNSFGHPNKEVIERIQKLGTKIYRTDEMGEIMIQVSKNGRKSVAIH